MAQQPALLPSFADGGTSPYSSPCASRIMALQKQHTSPQTYQLQLQRELVAALAACCSLDDWVRPGTSSSCRGGLTSTARPEQQGWCCALQEAPASTPWHMLWCSYKQQPHPCSGASSLPVVLISAPPPAQPHSFSLPNPTTLLPSQSNHNPTQ